MAEQMRAWFAEKDITYLPYDLNWGTEYNMGTEAELKQQKADVATASNLLNVIPDQTNRLNVLRRMYNALKPGGKIYITVHRESGKKPGESGADKWQNHWSLNEYLPEVQSVFGDSAIVQGGMIRATK
jgi:SAM-dependent methyltransferase